MKGCAIYPGSFDPVTYGHIDLIKRSRQIFDKVIVAVAHNVGKRPLFTVKERLRMLKECVGDVEGVIIDSFDGLVIDYARRQKTRIVIRGLRMISDFEYEFQMALTNRKLRPDIETIFMMPREEYSYLSSKLIKEAASLGADVKGFVPPVVAREINRRLKDFKQQ